MRVIVYEEPGIKFCEPLPNDWHLVGVELKRQLIEAGFEVYDEHEVIPDADKDIAFYADALLRPNHPLVHKKSLYISLEPPVINPRFYDRIQGWSYSRILTFSRQHVDNKRIFYSPYPNVRYIDWPMGGCYIRGSPEWVKLEERRKEKETRKDLCAITANKGSSHPAELYGARREIYRAMGKRLDLYGHGWQSDPLVNFVNYHGPCLHTSPIYQQYKHAISIENQWLEGYASEKYWTPLQAGCEFLIRIGWKPDFELKDCDEIGWSRGIVEHIKAIA